MSCFQFYSYRNIIVQYTNKEVFEHFSCKHSSRTCHDDPPSKYILGKSSHKTEEQSFTIKKREKRQIYQALALKPYRYLVKNAVKASSIFSLRNIKKVFEDCINVTLDPNLASSQFLAKNQPRVTKFFTVDTCLILQLSKKK